MEREGVRRAGEQAAGADLVLWVVDATEIEAKIGSGLPQVTELPPGLTAWIVVNKMDLVTTEQKTRIESKFSSFDESMFNGVNVNFLSSTTGAGIDDLVSGLSCFAAGFFTPEPALVARARHRAHLKDTVDALWDAQRAAQDGSEELMAEHLRLATRALGKLLGRVDVEDILDVIFRDFCIGK